MPIYEYACEKCGFADEIIEKVDSPKIKTCPACGAMGFKRPEVSKTAFHLKGGGWYKDGYCSPSSKKDTKPSGGSSSGDSGSGSAGTSSTSSTGGSGSDGA